jgi:Flp pilus assembly pilin Flp
MHDRDQRGLHGQGDGGQATVEYSLLIATGAVAVVGAMLLLAGSVERLFGKTADSAGGPVPALAECDPSYQGGCVPPAPPDLDCDDLAALGVPTPIEVVGTDPHNLDPDGNGLGCD